MKIGLVTWIGMGNFGTTLQSFALHEKLRRMGHDVYFLNISSNFSPVRSTIKYVLRLSGLLKMCWKHKFKAASPGNGAKLYRFVAANYNIKTPVYPLELRRLTAKTDVFLTGSDQIWNVKYRFDPMMFLSFAGETKRVAYASSIGVAAIPQEYRGAVSRLLNKFAHIGVREQSAVKALSEVTGREDITQVADPTFLLSPAEWSEICQGATYEVALPGRYMLCYLIGNNESYPRQVKDIAEKRGIKNVIVIPAVENKETNVEGATVYRQAGPAEFVDLIRRAELVCTDSFHATALSINLSKDFIELLRFKDGDETSQNSRIYDLLDQYGLRWRLYTNGSDVPAGQINYTHIQEKLKADKARSLQFLIDSIER